MDRSLIEAHLHREDSLNPLGIPSWKAQDPERTWVVDEVNDLAMAALDEAQAEMRRGGGDNYGVRLAVAEAHRPTSPKVADERPSKPVRDEALG